jgi:hypothetical protein
MGFVKDNIGTIGAGVGGVALGGVVGYLAGRRSSRKKTKRKRKSIRKTSRKRNYSNYKQKKPYTAGKRKDTSRRRIRYTKNNQPYVILANGRARFISKKSVRNSRKRSGGRY